MYAALVSFSPILLALLVSYAAVFLAGIAVGIAVEISRSGRG